MSFPNNTSLNSLDGSNGFRVEEVDGATRAGSSVAFIGDVNGDGLDDIFIGAPDAANGVGYVVFGSTSGFASSLETSTLDGTNGFAVRGAAAGDEAGASVAGGQDVNGDGIDDFVIGSPGADSGAGAVHVIYGTTAGFGAQLDLSAVDGTNGFVISGESAGDSLGASVDLVENLDGDSFAEVIVGAPGANGGQGEAYVLFGASALGSTISVTEIDGTNGFAIADASTGAGCGGRRCAGYQRRRPERYRGRRANHDHIGP